MSEKVGECGRERERERERERAKSKQDGKSLNFITMAGRLCIKIKA